MTHTRDLHQQDVAHTVNAAASLHAETSVLSIIGTYPDAYDAVADLLRPELFTAHELRALFVHIRSMIEAGKEPNAVSLSEAMQGRMSIAEVHEVLTFHDHTTRGLRQMVELLRERYQQRELHRIAIRMAEAACDTSAPVQQRIDSAMTELQRLEEAGGCDDDWVGAEEAAITHLDVIEARREGRIAGIATGLPDLDRMLDGGLQRGNLVVIGARPSMGKTALAMTIGLHIARTHSVGMFSMEMPHADLRDRQLAILGSIPLAHLRRPASEGLDYERLVDAVERAKRLRFFATDKSGLNILTLRGKARTMRRKHGLDVLIVDYIGLMAGTDPKAPRVYQIEEISRGLKALAKELDIAVVCLAQVNRGAMERANGVPGLHDLRDSGAIEQDSDVVAFIHRPIVANPAAGEQFAHYALLRVAKNRQGRTGDVHLYYHGDYTRFDAWAGDPPTARPATVSSARKGFDHEAAY